MAKIGKCVDFNPQSQRVGNTTPAGGSAPTPQAAIMKRGSAGGQTTQPRSPQKLRGLVGTAGIRG